jgi:hypothetical protein
MKEGKPYEKSRTFLISFGLVANVILTLFTKK